MPLIKIAAIAVALAMDAFAVSIAVGMTLKKIGFRQNFRLAWHFGFFQAIMPILGWTAGVSIQQWVENFDHWIAFLLLVYVSQGMLRASFNKKKQEVHHKDPTRGMPLILLSIATSIDALAVGFSLSMLKISIWIPAFIIGIVAGLFTVMGLQIGQKIGSVKHLRRYAEGCGGFILLAIGIKILYEHGMF
jgi:putative Mn2+ efflux pump MntP